MMSKLAAQLKFILLVFIIYIETNHDRSDTEKDDSLKEDFSFQSDYYH